MSDQSTTTQTLEADIEAQREHLAATVDQLAHKLDVKTQAQERLGALKDRVTTPAGSPRPELVAAATGLAVLAGLLVWWRRR